MEIGTWYLILLGLAILIPCIIILDIMYRKIKYKQEYLGLRAIGLFQFFIGLYLWYLVPPPLSPVRTGYGITYGPLDLLVSVLGLLLIGSGSIVAIMGPARLDISKRYAVCPVCFSEITIKDEDGEYVNEYGKVDEDGENIPIICTTCGGHFLLERKK
jgi:hypothetical protein